MATIAVIGALDTKGTELRYLKDQIEASGHATLLIDAGTLGASDPEADVSREHVAKAAGEKISDLVAAQDRGRAVAAMARGAEIIAADLHRQGRIQGIIGMGGSAGTAVATAAMRALPIGLPKMMISTMAGGNISGYVGVKDIIMIPSIVDVSGLNRFLRRIIVQAAAAISAMVSATVPPANDKPLICASMFGNTTACVEHARAILEQAGNEVLVFHATGSGGRTMEGLIESGSIAGVLDVTTTEWADELVGGELRAGPTRLEAAARAGVPAVVAPGCLDMVNFYAPETIPERFHGRRFYPHNPNVTLMRTTPEECRQLGEILASRINFSRGPVAVYLPLKGVSVISCEGQPFYWPEADQALFDSLRSNLKPNILVKELDVPINSPIFAETMANDLLSMMSAINS